MRILLFLLLLGLPAWAQELRDQELRIIQLTNEQRAKVGLPALVEVPGLSKVAHGWAREQLEDHLSGHESKRPGRRWPSDRVKAGGVKVRGISENCASYAGGAIEDLAGFFVGLWMASPHHRSSILDAHSRGIGVAIEFDGKEYKAVQLFSYTLEGEKTPQDSTITDRSGEDAPNLTRRGSLTLTPAQKRQADELAETMANHHGLIPTEMRIDAANAPLWFYLAEHRDPTVASGALEALGTIYTPNPEASARSDGKYYSRLLLDADYKSVTLRALKSPHRQVVLAGARLSANLLWGQHPDQETVLALESVFKSHPDPEVHQQVVGALWLLRKPNATRDRILVAALKDPQVQAVTSALFCLSEANLTPGAKSEILASCLELTRSKSDEVRCRVADALAGPSFEGRGKAGKALHSLLSDPSPAVRGRAAFNLGKTRRLESVARLVALVDDPGSTTMYTEGGASMGGADLGTVGDAALRALGNCTARMKGGFRYQLQDITGTPNEAQRQIMAAEAVRARQWLKTARGLPHQDE